MAITLSNATVAANALSGTVIGTFNTDGVRFQGNTRPEDFLIVGRLLCTTWDGQAIAGAISIAVQTPGGPPTPFTITITAPVVASPPSVPTSITLTPPSISMPDNSPSGAPLGTVAVKMNDGLPFIGAFTISPSGTVGISGGSNILLTRALAASDDGAHSFLITAAQNFVSVQATLALSVTASSPPPPPPVSPDGTTSAAPSGAVLRTAAGTWAWSAAPASGRPGEYYVNLNGSAVGIGLLMEVANGGQLYVNTATLGWYLWLGSGWTNSADPTAPPPPPPPPPPAPAPVIAVTPIQPQIPDTTAKGATVATFTVKMNDGSPFSGTVKFGPPNVDAGGIFALSGTSIVGGVATGQIIVNPTGPGVGPNAGTVTDHVTLVATQ